MKKIIVSTLAVALTAFTFNAVAETSTNPTNTDIQKSERMHKKHKKGNKLLEKLGLSDVQKTQIESIRATYKPQLKNIRENGKTLREQKKNLDAASSDYVTQVQNLFAQGSDNRAQAVTLRAQMKHEIALVLTADQRAQLKNLKQEMKSKQKKRRKNKNGRRDES